MSSLALSSYVDVQQYLIKILTGNISTSTGQNEESDAVNNAPHGAFWATLSYSDFVNGNVPGGMVDPNTGDPLKILVSGNAADSIIIQALLGTPGSLFDPTNPNGFGQMPADGPPFLTAAQVQPISDWINAGCPQ